MPRKKRQRIDLREENGSVVLDMGPIEIWDGADLALLRETVTRLVESDCRESLLFEMQHVKYVPSGFFGLMLDCHDRGVEIRLRRPTHYVAGMLWFRRFFEKTGTQAYQLTSGPDEDIPHDRPLPWTSEEDQVIWDANEINRTHMSSQ